MHRALGSKAKRAATAQHFLKEHRRLARVAPGAQRRETYKTSLRNVLLQSRRTCGCPLRAAQFALAQKCTFNGALTASCCLDEKLFWRISTKRVRGRIQAHRGIGRARSLRNAFDVIRS
eukprot:740401-Pyramimonas_sp.AAC.1